MNQFKQKETKTKYGFRESNFKIKEINLKTTRHKEQNTKQNKSD